MQEAVTRTCLDEVITSIDRRLYLGFVEHLGRCIYGGIYEPGHTSVNRHGFRTDVASASHELNVPLVRYPGDPCATKTAGDPPRAVPRKIDDAIVDRTTLSSTLPPLSWNVYRLAPTP